ncbi:MAG: glycosyltransferase family 4 protein [Acidothermales bacterium]|nr:glycosyltransferase family 4 protein [Acidothermales bacterium]
MRILIVTQYFWPEDFRVNDLATELTQRGHLVTVLTGQPSYPSRNLFPGYGRLRPWSQRLGDVRIKRVPLASRGRGQGWRLALNFLSFAASASLLGPLRARGGYDVIFVYEPSPVTVGIPAVVLKRVISAPVVFWVQDLWPETLTATGAVRSRVVLKALNRLVRWLYHESDRILVESEGFIPHALSNGAAPEKLAYVPNWAEGSYRPVDLPGDAAERQLVPPGFRVMFAGNLGVSQALGTILDAAELTREYADLHWVVLGDGRQRAWLAEQVLTRDLSGTVHLLGRHPVEAMPRFFALAEALLVTLKHEPIYALTIPSKLQSYLACGRPIVGALDGEGARVIAEAGAGLCGPAEDSEALAQAVLSLYRTPPDELAAMGRRGRAYFVKHFERERLLDQLEQSMRDTSEENRCVS